MCILNDDSNLDLFKIENDTLESADSIIENGEFKDDPLLNNYKDLVLQFKKMLKLTQKLVRISDGQQEYLQRIHSELKKEIEERKKTEKRLSYLATIDTLTNVYNRGTGLTLLSNQIKLTKRNKMSFCVCFIDLNGLKHVNDTYGHQEGDEFIITICNLIRETIRECDSISRIGGDELLVIFPECKEDDAKKILKKIVSSLQKKNNQINKPYKLDFSYGILEVDDKCKSNIDEIIEIADKRMYEQKKKYKKKAGLQK